MKRFFLLAASLLLCAACAHRAPSGPASPSPASPPADNPVQLQGDDDIQKLLTAIEPYVQKARATYPAVRERFLAGLPEGSALFVTAQLHDATGNMEQAFIQVETIHDGQIIGIIRNDINTVVAHHKGERYSFPEKELIDWTIVSADGSEEGNVVGTFLETWQQTAH
jgi:uncharacterized protein YegJ (DUF2314 family)